MLTLAAYDPDSILDQVVSLIKDDRSEGKIELPKRLTDNGNTSIRSRLLTYPVVKPPSTKIRHHHIIESYVELNNSLALIEKWKFAIEECETEEKSASNGLSLTLLFQAIKSILHFSTITSLKSQNKNVKIKTREWSGFGLCENDFQFKYESRSLPPAYLTNSTILFVDVKTIPRDTVHQVLSQLSDDNYYQRRTHHHGRIDEFQNGATSFRTLPNSNSVNTNGARLAGVGIIPATQSSSFHMRGRIPIVPREGDESSNDSNKTTFTSFSGDSGFMSDSSQIASDLDTSLFSTDEIFSPPPKQIRFNDERPTVRNLLTSPPIERQLKFIPVSTSVRLPFTFPTIRRRLSRPLLVNFEESLLHERFPCVGILEGFSLDIGAIGSFCPSHFKNNITVRHFSTVDDSPVVSVSPYLGVLKIPRNRGSFRRGYQIPRSGNIQLTLFNPEGGVVRIFSIGYDFNDMPPLSKTILRQRITCANNNKLKYLIHLRICSSKSEKIFLHGDVRLLFSTVYDDSKDDLKTKIEYPNPKYSRQTSKTSRVKSLSTSDAFESQSFPLV